MDSFGTTKPATNQAGGILKSVEVSKSNALRALDILIRSAIDKVNTRAIKIYCDAWRDITGSVYPNANSANTSIPKAQNLTVANL